MMCYARLEDLGLCDHPASVVFAGQHFCGHHADEIRRACGGSWVYFAERDGLVKIGMSYDLATRMRALQARLLAWDPGGREREKELHVRFLEHWSGYEWFRPAPELMAYVASLPNQEAVMT